MLAEKLNMTPEEAERWIVNLIRNARLDAKIDSKLVCLRPVNIHSTFAMEFMHTDVGVWRNDRPVCNVFSCNYISHDRCDDQLIGSTVDCRLKESEPLEK